MIEGEEAVVVALASAKAVAIGSEGSTRNNCQRNLRIGRWQEFRGIGCGFFDMEAC